MTTTGRFLAHWVWPIVFSARLIQYAFFDHPTHFMWWRASRAPHVAVYLVSAALVLLTIGRTRVELLYARLLVITTVALLSVAADLLIDRPYNRSVGSGLTWLMATVANMYFVLTRTTNVDDTGRA